MMRISLPGRTDELFGVKDENLRSLEEILKVRIKNDGSDLIVEGAEAGERQTVSVLNQLTTMMANGYALAGGDVRLAATLVSENENADLKDFLLKAVVRSGKKTIVPRSFNQRRYLEQILASDMVFGIGPAGTGKTYLAVAQAVSYLHTKAVARIILARPAVEAGEKLGFLPGDLQQKVDPYLRPLYDALYDMMEFEKVERLIARHVIEVAPIAFMRGRTLSDAFVIIDEAQNTTPEQMKMVLTRIGFGSKVVVTGDITQVDLPQGRTSGLVDAINVLNGVDGIGFSYFDQRDVVRHKLVQSVIKAYEKRETSGAAAGGPPAGSPNGGAA
ncbi:MAG: PhoH family protein [Vicinamibacteria bacterium]|nr:PhoH family protein [Vicinamibacteria bacterium]